MPLVVNHSMDLSPEQMKRAGEALLECLSIEGIPTGHLEVVFRRGLPEPEVSDDFRGERPASEPIPLFTLEFRTRARRTRAELQALRNQLVEALQKHPTLSSLQARKLLGLTHCDWAPAALRRMFRELESQGLIVQQGLKRGTCYVWKNSEAS